MTDIRSRKVQNFFCATNETIRSRPTEHLNLATIGLATCHALIFIGKDGKKSLTHLAPTNIRSDEKEEDYSFGFIKVARALIIREFDWIGADNLGTVRLVAGHNDSEVSKKDSIELIKLFNEIIGVEKYVKQRTPTGACSSNRKGGEIVPPDNYLEFAVISNSNNFLDLFLHIDTDGSYLPTIRYWGEEHTSFPSPEKCIMARRILEEDGLCDALAFKTNVTDKDYVRSKLKSYKDDFIMSHRGRDNILRLLDAKEKEYRLGDSGRVEPSTTRVPCVPVEEEKEYRLGDSGRVEPSTTRVPCVPVEEEPLKGFVSRLGNKDEAGYPLL